MDVQPVVAGQREQAVDHLEPLGAIRIIDPGDLHELLVFQPRGVAQRGQRRHDRVAVNPQLDLARALERIGQAGADRRPRGFDRLVVEVREVCGSGRPHRSMLPLLRIFRWSCMMP